MSIQLVQSAKSVNGLQDGQGQLMPANPPVQQADADLTQLMHLNEPSILEPCVSVASTSWALCLTYSCSTCHDSLETGGAAAASVIIDCTMDNMTIPVSVHAWVC